MKAVFNNEEFNLTFSIDLTASTEVLEAKLMDFLICVFLNGIVLSPDYFKKDFKIKYSAIAYKVI